MRSFHLGERSRDLDATASEYFRACRRRADGEASDDDVKLAARRLLAAARSFGRALANHRAKQPSAPLVGECRGCGSPIMLRGHGRPAKYHSAECYNLARRLHR